MNKIHYIDCDYDYDYDYDYNGGDSNDNVIAPFYGGAQNTHELEMPVLLSNSISLPTLLSKKYFCEYSKLLLSVNQVKPQKLIDLFLMAGNVKSLNCYWPIIYLLFGSW